MTETNDLDAQLLAQMREDFLAESQDILDRLGPLLVQLEQEPALSLSKGGDSGLLNTIFREVHTLKGTAGFAGFESIRLLAHKLEDVFGALRDEQLTVTPELMDTVFTGVQSLAAVREDVLRGGTGETDIDPLVARLEAALQSPEPVEGRGKVLAPTPSPASQAEPGAAPAPSPGESTLRVGLETLDTMMELVGELITARNALLTIAERLQDESLMGNAAIISRLTRELQTTVTAVRLVPVERLFNRFTSVVRNMARQRGKQVRLVVEGGDTPLDRAIWAISEQMYDPLVHLLRNAVDHGLEPTVDRRRAGKPEESTIRLSAERRGDDVVLCVADDGSGIDPARVRRVAVERGMYSAEEAAALSDEQAIHLIFASGFSTAARVTDVSGRGVGLDVVTQNVRRLRGNVSVETAIGQGTTFVIRLPLTLAILQVQLVRMRGYTYALPLHMVRETLQIALDSIQTMQQGEVVFVRDVALPVRRLRDWLSHATVEQAALGEPASPGSSGRGGADGIKPAIIVQRAGRDEVLVVDELVGKQQVVLKPLSPYLGTVQGVEGAAILPDGSVTLILDVEGLAN
jgi:two-component system chemotaxis sensor kinase CheA